MTDSSFAAITQSAIDSMAKAPNARLRDVLSVVLRHLHDAIRETRLTAAEWEAVIAFLTRTGETCSAERQEFILLSDVLGVSMLVDALNHASGSGVSESTVFGPFYAGRQPILPVGTSILKRAEKGASLRMRGTVRSQDGTPTSGALVEVWQAAPNGLYDVQDPAQPAGHLRASFETAADGSFAFETILPVSYAIPDDGPVGDLLQALGRHPNRPAHIHFMITASGCRPLVTHLFIDGDPYLESDAVFGVKSSLVVRPQRRADGSLAIDYPFTLAGAAMGQDG